MTNANKYFYTRNDSRTRSFTIFAHYPSEEANGNGSSAAYVATIQEKEDVKSFLAAIDASYDHLHIVEGRKVPKQVFQFIQNCGNDAYNMVTEEEFYDSKANTYIARLTDEEKKAKRKARRLARKVKKEAEKETPSPSSDIPKLTKLEQDVILNGFGNNDYANDGSPVWSWSIQPSCKEVTEKQISGVLSSLVKKGLANKEPWYKGNDTTTPDDHTVELTEEGQRCLAYLR